MPSTSLMLRQPPADGAPPDISRARARSSHDHGRRAVDRIVDPERQTRILRVQGAEILHSRGFAPHEAMPAFSNDLARVVDVMGRRLATVEPAQNVGREPAPGMHRIGTPSYGDIEGPSFGDCVHL